jgi:hypothetical protein
MTSSSRGDAILGPLPTARFGRFFVARDPDSDDHLSYGAKLSSKNPIPL